MDVKATVLLEQPLDRDVSLSHGRVARPRRQQDVRRDAGPEQPRGDLIVKRVRRFQSRQVGQDFVPGVFAALADPLPPGIFPGHGIVEFDQLTGGIGQDTGPPETAGQMGLTEDMLG